MNALRVVGTAFCLGSLLALQTVAAESLVVETSPPSRRYLDAVTGSVYHYDAASGTLTPTGEFSAAPAGYVVVDAYPRGAHPSPLTGGLGPCAYDDCNGGVVAVVGARSVRIETEIWAFDLAGCPPMKRTETRGPLLGVVTYVRWTWGVDACTPGTACATVYLDHVPHARDCTGSEV